MPAGRPTLYKPDIHPKIVKNLCRLLGSIDVEICKILEISTTTFYEWQSKHPEFSDAVKEGKLEFDNELIISALRHRAIGYSHQAEKIFYNQKTGEVVRVPYTKHYAPEVAAIMAWLYNRDPENWKRQQIVTHQLNPLLSKDDMSKFLDDLSGVGGSVGAGDSAGELPESTDYEELKDGQ